MEFVYQSNTMIVADGRLLLTPEEAYSVLLKGKSINICNPPDFSAENECDIYDHGYDANYHGLLKQWEIEGLSQDEKRSYIINELGYYELSEA